MADEEGGLGVDEDDELLVATSVVSLGNSNE
jgi:hypothetical protein